MNSLQSLNLYINIKAKNMCIKLQVSFYSFISLNSMSLFVNGFLFPCISLLFNYSAFSPFRTFFCFIFFKYFSSPLLVRWWFWFFTFLTLIFHCSFRYTRVFHRTSAKLVFVSCHEWFLILVSVIWLSIHLPVVLNASTHIQHKHTTYTGSSICQIAVQCFWWFWCFSLFVCMCATFYSLPFGMCVYFLTNDWSISCALKSA